jgi:putative phage-type endonuclease
MTDPLREQELSKDGLGASEVAAALGLSPYESPLELWLKKTSEAAEEEDSDAGEWGLTVEPALRRWYERKHRVAVWHPLRSMFHPEIPWLRATPDGIALSASAALSLPAPPEGLPGTWVWDREVVPPREIWEHGFEAKNTNWRQAHRWGEPGSDDVPLEHIIQCQQGMAVTGLASWRVVASVGGQPPVVYVIERDDDLISQMLVGAIAFMQSVWDKTPPPIDSSPAWSGYIARRYPFAVDRPVVADSKQEALAAQLRDIRQRENDLEEVRTKIESQLKMAIGEHSGLKTTLGTISWRPSKPARPVDYKAAFTDLATRMGMTEVGRTQHEERFRVEHKAARPFVVPRAWLLPGHEGDRPGRKKGEKE